MFVHWKILHASKRSRLAWRRLGGVFNLLRKAYFSHNTIHHVKTYKSSYYIQFDSKKKKNALDSKLNSHPNFRIIGDRYGLTISGFWENTVFMAIPIGGAIIVFSYIAPEFTWLGVLLATIPMLLSKYIHPLLHDKKFATKRKSEIIKYFVESKYFLYIQKYHYIHHQYALCNFNLMPGGDYLFGVARHLTPKPTKAPGPFNLSEYRITKPFTGRAKGARR
jgi:hypothetical protein